MHGKCKTDSTIEKSVYFGLNYIVELWSVLRCALPNNDYGSFLIVYERTDNRYLVIKQYISFFLFLYFHIFVFHIFFLFKYSWVITLVSINMLHIWMYLCNLRINMHYVLTILLEQNHGCYFVKMFCISPHPKLKLLAVWTAYRLYLSVALHHQSSVTVFPIQNNREKLQYTPSSLILSLLIPHASVHLWFSWCSLCGIPHFKVKTFVMFLFNISWESRKCLSHGSLLHVWSFTCSHTSTASLRPEKPSRRHTQLIKGRAVRHTHTHTRIHKNQHSSMSRDRIYTRIHTSSGTSLER